MGISPYYIEPVIPSKQWLGGKNSEASEKDASQDLNMGLLVYRTTPLECGNNHAQLLMGRRLQANLPVKEGL